MSHPLISRNSDLQRLLDDGYEVTIQAGHLVIDSVPYVNARSEIRLAKLISDLSLAGDDTRKPENHVVYFAGEYPCNEHGQPLEKLRHASENKDFGDGLRSDHSFSKKPKDGYVDYHHKMETLISIISEPAQKLDPNVTAKTRRVVENYDGSSPFVYLDTASARAGIGAVTKKLGLNRVAIIGLGGTGAYVLDFLAKTPVNEIVLYDRDEFLTHNAFRAPGAASLDELRQVPKKVDYFKAKYSNMHRGIVANAVHLDETTLPAFPECEFVFLCMDASPAKRAIVTRLEQHDVPFVDVGMGLTLVDDDRLTGLVRLATSTPEKRDHVHAKKRIPFQDGGENIYSSNIQVADLNAFNAVLAVIRWKKYFGFYADLDHEHFTAYALDGNLLINEDRS
jgi:hypothetical protein